VVTLILSSVVITITNPEDTLLHSIVILIALGYIIQSVDVIDFFFQSQLKAKWIAISRFTSLLAFGVLKLSFVHFQFSLTYFIWAQLGEMLTSGLFLCFFYRIEYGRIFQWQINPISARAMLRESMPILFAEIAIIIYMRIDQVMIGNMLGNGALGIFSAAVRLSEVWYMVPVVICSATFPSIVKAYTTNRLEYQQKMQGLYDLLIWLGILVSIVISVFASTIVRLIYGNQFTDSASILIIHTWTSVFVFMGFASNQQLVLERLTQISFYRTLFGLTGNVLFNLLLIPLWGAKGAAVSTLVAQALSNCLSNYFFKEARGIFWANVRAFNVKRIISSYLFRNT
jgi:O-antigen/teichoic acid export membrane protein